MSVSRALLTAPAALLGGVVALVPVAPAAADTEAEFPASADSTLVHLEVPEEGVRGFWGHVHVESELGDDRAAAEFATDPTDITPYLNVAGPQRSEVGTSAEESGRAEAHTAAAGVELVLPGEEERPLVSVGGLHTSVACDFHGNLSWDQALGGSGFSERVVTVMDTPIAADGPEVTEVVEGPGGKATEVTVVTDQPDEENARSGSVGTTVTAVQDGEELFELILGEVAVECGTPEDTVDGESGAEGGEATASDGPDGADERSGDLPEAATEERATPEAGTGTAPAEEEPDAEEPVEEAPAGPDHEDADRDRSADEDTAAGTDRGSSGEGLPVTGAAVAGLAAVGTLALAGGGLALYLGRKRRSTVPDDG